MVWLPSKIGPDLEFGHLTGGKMKPDAELLGFGWQVKFKLVWNSVAKCKI